MFDCCNKASKVSSPANAKDCSPEAAALGFVSATSSHRVCCQVESHYSWVDVQKPSMSKTGKKNHEKKVVLVFFVFFTSNSTVCPES